MSKDSILDWDQTAGNNTDIGGIDIAEGCEAANINNAIREAMAQQADAVTRRVTKSANYTAVKTDYNQLIEFTAAATLSLTAAATLGDGWACLVKANGGAVTIDPNGSETIDGSTTKTLADGNYLAIFCNGTAFFTVGVNEGDITIYNTDGGASFGPTIMLVRNSASPANSDQLGQLRFVGKDNAANDTAYARIYAQTSNVVDGAEAGLFVISTASAGSLVNAATFSVAGMTTPYAVQSVGGGSVSSPSIKPGNDADTGMYLIADGQVGFAVAGTLSAEIRQNQLIAGGGGISTPGLSFIGDENTGFYNSANGEISTSCNGAQKMRINGSGLRCQAINDVTTGAAANVFINSSTGDVARSTSSLRYKENVRDYERGLADLLTLRPVRYNGKSDGDLEFAGLIAEEVEAAGMSEYVVYDEEGRPDALHYPHMVALLINAVKDLEARVKSLESERNS